MVWTCNHSNIIDRNEYVKESTKIYLRNHLLHIADLLLGHMLNMLHRLRILLADRILINNRAGVRVGGSSDEAAHAHKIRALILP